MAGQGKKAGAPEPGDPREKEGRERSAFLLRLSPGLLADLRVWANQELRSLNGHIEFLLREAVRRHRDPG